MSEATPVMDFVASEHGKVARFLAANPSQAANQWVTRVQTLLAMLLDCDRQRLQWKAEAERRNPQVLTDLLCAASRQQGIAETRMGLATPCGN